MSDLTNPATKGIRLESARGAGTVTIFDGEATDAELAERWVTVDEQMAFDVEDIR